MASLAEMAKATAPRTVELKNEITVEEAYAKLQARAAAFQMPFELKKGITGPHIAFKRLGISSWHDPRHLLHRI